MQFVGVALAQQVQGPVSDLPICSITNEKVYNDVFTYSLLH